MGVCGLKRLRRFLSIILVIVFVLSLFNGLSVVTNAASYPNGYTGAMAGDGKIYTHGLDVSKWQQGNINFTDVKNAGYSYVILRCGTTKGKDACFEEFYTQAKDAGLDVGTYYYSYATSVAEATTDVNNCLSWIKGKKFEYPVYFDYEDDSQSGLSTTLAAQICYTFLDKLKAEGYLPGLYSMASWLEQSWITSSGLRNDYEGWIARYMNSGTYDQYGTTYSTKYGMYQYTDKKYVNGKGPYDANICYKDYPSIVKKYGFNGYTGGHSLESNPTHQKLKNIVFDAGFYYSRYEDVRNAIGLDGDKLYEHFLNNGIKEGRCGSPYFDVKWYMTKNDQGLIDHCNGDYMKAYEHFLDYVEEPSEMTGTPKKLSPVLDINYYKNNYSDLRNTGWTTEYQYLTHFVNSGVNEFRQGSAEFDPVSYAYFNDDVRNAYGTENKDKYYFHYMAYGINETDMAGRKRIADYENYGKTFYATISEINTGKVLEYIPDASVSGFSDNNAVQINTSNGSDEQLWKFERNEDGTYKVINVKYNKYLNGSATFLGATDKITDANEVFQNWKIMNKNGNCVLKVGAGNRVVDNAVSTDNYSAVKIWDFNGNPNQQFRINIIGENYGEKFRAQINTVVHGAFVLSPNENGSIVVNANDGADDKYWDFERQSDGSYKIKHVATGKVLDVQGGLTKNYTDIALYEDNGTAAQRWLIVAEPFNSISLRPVCGLDANVALDLNGKGAGSQLSNGDNISIYEYLGSDGQRFEIKKVAVNVGLLGDVNNDGTVSIMDATTVQLSIASLCTLTENETLRADVDSNKNIDIMDATAIQRYLVQYAVGYPIGQSLEII